MRAYYKGRIHPLSYASENYNPHRVYVAIEYATLSEFGTACKVMIK